MKQQFNKHFFGETLVSYLELRHNQVVQVHPEVHVVPEVLRLLVHPSIEKLNVSIYKNCDSQ